MRQALLLLLCLCMVRLSAQDTIPDTDKLEIPAQYKFKSTDIIAPVSLIAIGVAGIALKPLKQLNREISRNLWQAGQKDLKIDNFTPYLPVIATYGLNLCGVKGEHDYADLTIITVTAHLLMAATVYPLKDFVHSPRPNGENFNSFPSGHTAWAFTGAEIMRREYWNKSPWLAMSGYVVAAGTAFMRLYNGAHWLTDVLAGAGIGILAAEAAYWLYPAVVKNLFPSIYRSNILIAPAASSRSFAINAALTF